MIRSERTFDDLVVTCVSQFEKANEIDGILRVKWILNVEQSSQFDEDELKLFTIRVKNKTL